MRPRSIVLLLGLGAVLGLWLLNKGCLESTNVEALRARVTTQLKVGDSRERVEQVLRSSGIHYSYDRFQSRFQSTVDDSRCGLKQAISLYVYLDSAQKMLKVEAFASYTMP